MKSLYFIFRKNASILYFFCALFSLYNEEYFSVLIWIVLYYFEWRLISDALNRETKSKQ